MKDVARLAGVSAMTVSNVVNGNRPVRGSTRDRVEDAIATLGYRPNPSARRLRSGRSGVVALAVPTVGSAYFAELAELVIEAAKQHSWTVLVDQTGGNREHERTVLSGLWDQLVDGQILFPQELTRDDLTGATGKVPTVLLGDRGSSSASDVVVIDNAAAARLATTHLVELGRRRIAVVGGRSGRSTSAVERLRTKGAKEALRRAGLPVVPDLVVPADRFDRAGGAAAMAALLDRPDPPDAVFCLTDSLALGALHVAVTRGVRVPEDLAVVGFDDIEDGRYSNPALTTVAPDKGEIARTAAELLAARIAGATDLPTRHVAHHRLVVRATTVR